jgi:hypothetical protein
MAKQGGNNVLRVSDGGRFRKDKVAKKPWNRGSTAGRGRPESAGRGLVSAPGAAYAAAGRGVSFQSP